MPSDVDWMQQALTLAERARLKCMRGEADGIVRTFG